MAENDMEISEYLKKILDKTDSGDFTIKKIDQFHDLISFLNKSENFFLFRGQEESSLKLESSWLRDKIKYSGSPEDYRKNILVFNDYINKIRLKNAYKNMSSLEILASLQHSKDVSTPLIDFTDDVLLAFWFALATHTGKNDAALFILKTDANNVKKEIDMKNFNSESINHIFESPNVSQRALSQRSYFIVDSKDWGREKNVLKIVIDKNVIEKIQSYLRIKNKNHRSVYPDLKGEYMDAVSSTAATYFLEGYVKAENKNYEGAIKDYTKAIELDPNFVSAYNNRGVAYAEKTLPDYEKAISNYTKAIELDPSHVKAYNNRGNAYSEQITLNYEKAISDYTKAIELDPNYAGAYNNRGVAYVKQSKPNYRAALIDWKKARELGWKGLDKAISDLEKKVKGEINE